MKPPAFQFYPATYINSQRVQMLTLEEEGAYLRLLCSCWQHGSIPADPEIAARLIGKGCSTTVARVVVGLFMPSSDPTRLVHDRLEEERRKQTEWREKSAQGGRKSQENRKGGSRVVQGARLNTMSEIESVSVSVSESGIKTKTPIIPAKSPEQRRAEKLFKRRETTPWDRACTRAWATAKGTVINTTDEEWLLLEWYFSLPDSEELYRRKSLDTLLNNWSAEIDRARQKKFAGVREMTTDQRNELGLRI